MEGPNQGEIQEVPKTKEILALLNTLKMKAGVPFVFDDKQYQIIWVERDDIQDGDEAFYSASTEIEGFDIYMLRTLSKEDKKRQLFHEILEIYLEKQGLPTDQTHLIVLREEERIFGKR